MQVVSTDIEAHIDCEPHRLTSFSSDATLLCDMQTPAMAYVPSQSWNQPYPLAKGFQNGTIFPALNKPFAPNERSCKK